MGCVTSMFAIVIASRRLQRHSNAHSPQARPLDCLMAIFLIVGCSDDFYLSALGFLLWQLAGVIPDSTVIRAACACLIY